MAIRIGINGLGRIGRLVWRAVEELGRDDLKVVAVNGPATNDTHAQLLKYDSLHGVFAGTISHDAKTINMGSGNVPVYHERDPQNIPWKKHQVDVLLECTGAFTKKADAEKHIASGAKKILISAPSPDADATIVYGVNNKVLKKSHRVISVGSCTTNCLAPVAKTLNDAVGIQQGFMTTIHAYTGDQNLVDSSHKDLRRARAAALSMVPTSTGAAKALGLVLPELAGKLDGTAIRVPVANVSMVDLTFTAARDTSADEINAAIVKAAKGKMQGILGTSNLPLVSIDFNHRPESSIFDLTGTTVVNKRFVRVAAWYDNEWGFSCRMLDVAALAGK
ncbi:MAG: type I glyceraldehyde-3-phosphate dehydrogenase [Alphaproteobacteria bacterium]|nr:type I glyceraldehyde-3-phosphate dehydrogenase [Alphaproteobacteria bacterium]